MSELENVNFNLKEIVKGGGFTLIGLLISFLISFLIRLFIIRSFTQTEYGIFTLSLTILSIFITVLLLGLSAGVIRFIAYYRGKKDLKKVKGTIISALHIGVISGLIGFFLMFFGSGFLSNLFNEPSLESGLKILAISLPLTIIATLLINSFQGFGNVRPKIFIKDIGSNIVRFILVIFVILAGYRLLGLFVIYAFVSIFLLIGSFVFYKKLRLPKKYKLLRKKLIIFSLPLLSITISSLILNKFDTLMIGFYMESSFIGLYDGSVVLAQFIPQIFSSIFILYLPISTFLFSRGKNSEIKKIYSTITKWGIIIIFPLFLILFLFPDVVLSFLYGSEYIGGKLVLQILSLGFLVHVLLGPNGSTLIAFGKERLVSSLQVFAIVLNIILNIILIPLMGIVGAAIATASSFILINILYSFFLYKKNKIHPFTKTYLKPFLLSLISIFIIYFISITFLVIEYWMLPFLLILFMIIYVISIFSTKSLTNEDIDLLISIEKRSSLNLRLFKKLLKKFI